MDIKGLFSAILHRKGQRIATCPETHRKVGVRVNYRFAVSACSRWPEKAGCDQACVPEIKAAPEDTLVRNIVQRWYAGQTCAFCAKPIDAIGGAAIVPGLRAPDGTLHAWKDIPIDSLTDALANSIAVCAACDLTEEFVRANPRLVVDRHATVTHKKRVFAPPSAAVY